MTPEASKALSPAQNAEFYRLVEELGSGRMQAVDVARLAALRSQPGMLAREEVARIIDPIAFSALTTRPPRKTLQKMAFEKADAILALTPSHEAGTHEIQSSDGGVEKHGTLGADTQREPRRTSPDRGVATHPSEAIKAGTQEPVAFEMLALAAEFEGEAKAHNAMGDKDEYTKCLRAAYALRKCAAPASQDATREATDLYDLFVNHYWDSFEGNKDLIMKHVGFVLSLAPNPKVLIEECAQIVERWSLPTIQTPSMWLVDKAAIAAEIRALASPARADRAVTADKRTEAKDTWFVDSTLPIMAMSGDVESDRVLKLHFRRKVTDADRARLVEILNAGERALSREDAVAWIVLAKDTDNIRIWWRDKERADDWAKTHSAPIFPLYAHPLHADAILSLGSPVPSVAADNRANVVFVETDWPEKDIALANWFNALQGRPTESDWDALMDLLRITDTDHVDWDEMAEVRLGQKSPSAADESAKS